MIKSATHMQLYLAIGLPLIAMLMSLTICLVQIFRLRAPMKLVREGARELRVDLKSDMDLLRKDMRELRADVKLLTREVSEILGGR